MKTAMKAAGVLIAASLLLTGCANIYGLGGSDFETIAQRIDDVEGIENVSFVHTDEEKEYQNVNRLEVTVEDGYFIADKPAFINFILRNAWNLKKDAANGDDFEVIIDGGVPQNYDWFDDIIESNPDGRMFNFFRIHYDEASPKIVAGVAGLTLMYDNGPGNPVSLNSSVVQKGEIPKIEPSALLYPSTNTTNSESENGRQIRVEGLLNDIEATPYVGKVTATLFKDGKEIGSSELEYAYGNAGPDISHHFDYDPEAEKQDYVVRFEMTPQDGFDTDTREYKFHLYY